ncbi:MAG: AIR synthase-related protein [Promethearchaeota archaeon]
MSSERPESAKLGPEALERLVLDLLGASPEKLLVAPGPGRDYGAASIGGGKVLVATTDPVYVLPLFGWKWAGWFAYQILVADAYASGIPPSFLSITLNLPPSTPDQTLRNIWSSISEACAETGVTVLCGHTARYEGCSFPTVGAGTVLSLGDEGDLLSTSLVEPGDEILVTTGLGVEAALTLQCKELNAGKTGEPTVPDGFSALSVVREAEAVVAAGGRKSGVSCMHDAAEGGVLGSLFEVLRATGFGADVDAAAVDNPVSFQATLEKHGLDPWSSSSQGTMLVFCRPEATSRVSGSIQAAGVDCWVAGSVTRGPPKVKFFGGGVARELRAPPPDEFWAAFTK